ncbi:hypothetical protein ABZX75_25510 [Streptomyces sp. NPDC003038]|uniref:hypothetical protein n=1 Tax=unclassified Streptomyces TaxID=2593676 RepID=UPI0033AE8008
MNVAENVALALIAATTAIRGCAVDALKEATRPARPRDVPAAAPAGGAEQQWGSA